MHIPQMVYIGLTQHYQDPENGIQLLMVMEYLSLWLEVEIIYIIPEMEIVEIKVQQMLTTSLPTNSTPVDPGSSDAPEIYDVLQLFEDE